MTLNTSYTCFNRISVTDRDFEAKERHLAAQLELETVSDDEDRRNLAREFLLENARSKELWPRRNSLRELAYVLKKYPDLIRDADASELESIAKKSDDETFRRELRGLLKARAGGR